MYDTQLIIYALNGDQQLPSEGCAISSTTAQELLLMQGQLTTRNNYYVPMPAVDRRRVVVNDFLGAMRSWSGRNGLIRGKRTTDSLILDFNGEYPTVVEYSHQALARALNTRNYKLLEHLSRTLGPDRHRVVARRLRFLMNHEVQCTALSQRSADTGLDLFDAFVASYALKGNFRNSLNDLLTLAVAQSSSAVLFTADQLLGRFAHEHSAVPINHTAERTSIDYTQPPTARRTNRGAKGYVNRRWRVTSFAARQGGIG